MQTQLGRSAVIVLISYVAVLGSAVAASQVNWPIWATSLLASAVFLLLLYGLGAFAFRVLMKHGRLNTRPIGPIRSGPLAGYVAMLAAWCSAVALVFWWLPRISGGLLVIVLTVAVAGLAVVIHFAELSSSGDGHRASQ